MLTNVNLNITLTNDRPSLSGIPAGVVYTVGATSINVGAVAAVRDDDDTHLRGMDVVRAGVQLHWTGCIASITLLAKSAACFCACYPDVSIFHVHLAPSVILIVCFLSFFLHMHASLSCR